MVNLIIVDGAARRARMEYAIEQKYAWIPFLHCVSHIGSLVVNAIGKIPQVAKLCVIVIDCQN